MGPDSPAADELSLSPVLSPVQSPVPVPWVRAHGDPYEAGFRHGVARAEALHAFLDDGLARLNRLLPEPVSVDSLRPRLAAYDAEIRAAAPDLAEELSGLAEGAGIGREEAVLLQVRREILGFSRIPSPSRTPRHDRVPGQGRIVRHNGIPAHGDCTTYACPGSASDPEGRPAVLAQTVDLNGDLDDQIAVLDVARSGVAGRRALVLSFGGLLGYLGINSDGLAIGLNLVLGGQWRPGLPPYLAIRHLLDHASCVDEAIAMVRGLRLTSSRALTFCDVSKAACVEILGDEYRVLEEREPMHTNHFLHQDFVPCDELNVFARNSSLLRLKACEAGLAALPEPSPAHAVSVEERFKMLATAPICVADTGDIRRERTVATVVMLPGRGELHVRPGDPSRSATVSFTLAAP